MYYHDATGQYIRLDVAFKIGNTDYPSNWLRLSTPQEKLDAGFVEVVEVGFRGDTHDYFVSELLNGAVLTVTSTPKTPQEIEALEKTVYVEATNYIFKIILNRRSLLVSAEAIIAAGSKEIQLEWDGAPVIRRKGPLFKALKLGLSLSRKQINNIFQDAINLQNSLGNEDEN